ncbi:MAG TPA: hypothetical protein PKK95_03025 [Vicinamibacterales bacterium]|nr:hypothetical protein [Acidobacteriota bacterium]HOC17210.1 hypothetical protein [Vicinamibacterales bacterium]
MSAGRALAGVLVVFAATAVLHPLLGGSARGQLVEVVAVCAIAYASFSVTFGRIRWPFLALVTAVFLVLRAADLYWLPEPLLSGPLSWVVVPALVAALLLVGRRYFFTG